MWQVVLGAAIAGSTGIVAKRFFNPFSRHCSPPKNQLEDEEPVTPPPVGIGFLDSSCDKTDGVFRFSSSGSTVNSGSGSGSRKSSGVKCKVRIRGLKKNKTKIKNGECHEIEKRSGNVTAVKTKTDVCLKKPRTLGTASASNSKDHSSFSSALGVCMMYMMSAEKRDMSKLNAATEETVKAIKELKDELSRIKSLQGFKFPGCSEKSSRKSGQVDFSRSEMASRESLDIKSRNDGEYASSVLTEEPEQEAVEMEQLEMELESELQKLNLAETSEVMEECKGLVNGSESYQCGGISASELDKKLSHLLIEQQEGQINELEAELQTAQSKLQEKEAELQALKVCVRRLTEFPLLDRSDDEHEQDMNQDVSVSWSQHNQTDNEGRKPTIGMKRPMESSSIHV
ncbi:unnamed protein product [Microthlaspi erraticum]|uniref:POLAR LOCALIZATION DURING ASYMMETRIC DIVISION AND protein n=1 Tax=Microthlaspi erraticum TaxID=1685480 RepID=A0A6D2IWK9_9BRAS|nr:unnamed protein product [Microthlaspi erraticum]